MKSSNSFENLVSEDSRVFVDSHHVRKEDENTHAIEILEEVKENLRSFHIDNISINI